MKNIVKQLFNIIILSVIIGTSCEKVQAEKVNMPSNTYWEGSLDCSGWDLPSTAAGWKANASNTVGVEADKLSVLETGSVTITRKNYYFRINGKNGYSAGGGVNEALVYRVIKENGVKGDWTEYKPTGEKGTYEQRWDAETGTEIHPLDKRQVNVDLSQLEGILHENENERSYVSVEFAFLIGAWVSTPSKDCSDPVGAIRTDGVVVKVYHCDGGLIQAAGMTPKVNNSTEDMYYVYPEDDGNGLSVDNEEDPTNFKWDSQQTYQWILYDRDINIRDTKTIKKSNVSYKYGYNFTYEDLKKAFGSSFKPGMEFYVGRRNYLDGNVGCESNSLHYKVVSEVKLPGFDQKYDLRFCEKKSRTEASDDCFQFAGQKVDIKNGFNENDYDLLYQWEYKVSGHGWKTMTSASAFDDDQGDDGAPINYAVASGAGANELYLKQEQLKKGLVYQFRQKVVLRKFSNREIYAEEEEGSYPTIRLQTYENLSEKDLTMQKLPKVCYGMTSETAVKVDFNPVSEIDKYNLYEDVLEYDYTVKGLDINGKEQTLSLNVPLDALVTENLPVQVTVKDGCENAIILKDTIKVKSQPELLPSMVTGLNCVTTADKFGGINIVVALGQTSAQIGISGTDPLFSVSRYYIALGNKTESGEIVYNEWQLMDKTSGFSILADKFRYAKLKKETDGCESTDVLCVIQNCETFINTIGIGSTHDTDYRICQGDGNPAVLNDILVGAYGEESYTYAWKYSLDGEIWTIITEQNEKNLPQGVIDPKADVYYILREVTSTMGVTQINNASNKVTIRKYSTPKLELYAYDAKKDLYACYGDKLKFEVKDLANVSEKEGATLRYNLFYKDASNKYHSCYPNWSNEPVYSGFEVTQDTTIYGAAILCNDTVFSNPINVSVGKQLDNFDVSLGACRIKGDSVKVTLPTATGFTYNFIYNDKVYDAKTNSIYVKLPLADKATYLVRVSNGNCSKTVEKSVEEFEMQDRLIKHPLFVEQDLIGGKICAGNTVNISSQNTEGVDGKLVYSWYENGDQLACNSSLLPYTPKKAGTKNTVVRKTDFYTKGVAEYCMSVFDTILVETYNPLTFGNNSISDSKFCYADTAVIYVDKADGGSGQGIEYNLYKKDAGSNDVVWIAKANNIDINDYQVRNVVYNSGIYSIEIKDQLCQSSLYTNNAQIGSFTVNPDESFTLLTSKSLIEESELEDGKQASITLTSPAIDKWFETSTDSELKVTYTYNGTTSKSVSYGKGTGIGLKIAETDFNEDGVLRIGVKKGTSACNYTAFIDIFYSKGFNAQPLVKCEESKSEREIAGCRGQSAHLFVDTDNMPTYNDSPMDLKRVSYQWYKLGEQSTVQLGSQTSSALTVEVGDSTSYRCQIIYDAENTGKNLKRVYSTTYIVKPIEVAEIGNVYFGENGMFTKYACAGSSDKITLDANVKGNAKTMRMVWQSSTDGAKWTNLANTGSLVTGATTSSCQVNTELWSSVGVEAVYFRLMVENTECDETAYSDNTIVLRIVDRPKMDISKVKMEGDGVVSDALTSLNFYTYKDANFKYNWSYGNNNNYEQAAVYTLTNSKGFVAGEDSLFVYKENDKGCVSDTVAYHFNLYNALSAAWNQTSTQCPGNDEIELIVWGIRGGTEKVEDYKVEWLYRTNDMTSFDVINKEGKNYPFTYDLIESQKMSFGVRTSIIFSSVKDNFELRAVVDCENYPGQSLALPIKTINLLPKIESWIDANEETVCYGEPFIFIDAIPSEGGTGKFSYQWQKSVDKETWTDIKEQTSCKFRGRVEMPIYQLQQTTYFRRIAKDTVCSSFDTSAVKTVLVLPEVQIPANVLNYYPAVLSGENVTIQPNFSEYDYIWNKIGAVGEEDTTLGLLNYGRYETEPLYDKTSYRYRVRYQNTPYCASAWDTITIDVLETGGVELFFENQLSNTDRYDSDGKYWICSGGEAGTIRANGSNGSTRHQWMYGINGSNLLKMYYEDGTPASGETVNADECQKIANALRNTEGTAPATKYVSFCRVDTFIAGGRVIPVPSDTIKVYIVPSLSLSADVWNMTDSLAGVLSTPRRNFCVNEEAVNIKRSVSQKVEDFWFGNKISPRLYDSKRSTDSLRISWEYTEGTNNAVWQTAKEASVADYLGVGTFNIGEYVDNLSGIYQVRSVLSDGCSNVYSNNIRLNWSDVKAEEGSIKVYAVLDEDEVINNGFEIGDSIVIQCNTNEYPCYWFSDSKCTDTIKSNSRTCGFKLEGDLLDQLMSDPHIYVKRYDDATGCFSTEVAIAVNFGTDSRGGKIASSQQICRGEKFDGISSRTNASGDYLYPEAENMHFEYTWQYSTDNKQKTWVNVGGYSEKVLPAEKVDSIVDILGKPTYWFRRVAKNDSGRVCYSDTIVLEYYNDLQPGVLSLSETSAGYCESYMMPIIRTTHPDGGYLENGGYEYEWQMKINDGEFKTVVNTPLDSIKLSYLDLDTLNREQNNVLTFRCVYSDNCGKAASNEVKTVLYRLNTMPNIYEDNKCEADTIVVKVFKEDIEKEYTWLAYDEDGSVNWSWSKVDSKTIVRNMESQLSSVEYGIYSTDVETGCRSAENYFNVDSMPTLRQEKLEAPAVVCYGEKHTIKGGEAIGGNGVKTYSWQYSYDGLEWNDYANMEGTDLTIADPTPSVYYRRIVKDMCGADTTAPIYVRVREKVSVKPEDLVLYDHKCVGHNFNVKLAEGIKNSDNDYYRIWIKKDIEWTSTVGSTSETVKGFDTDSLELRLSHVIIDSLGKECSAEISVYAHNAVPIDHEKNFITGTNLTPCNGRLVDIDGEAQEGATEGWITYKWYVNNDNIHWTEQLLKTDKDLRVEAKDTMYVRRLAYNGCVYDTSNVVLIIGSKVEEYEYVDKLGLSVVSNMQDSSVVLYMERGKEFAEDYNVEGDGILPKVVGNETVLPYKSELYKDSLLQIVAISDHCVNSYRVTPLRGGVISFDGEGLLCGGSEIPAIVVTDIEGGVGEYHYQWQYKNFYTSDFINIEGANSKEYTPKAVSVATDYRRVTTSGVYTSYSNVVRVNIRPLPKANDIVISLSDSEVASYGLTKTAYSVEKLPATALALRDSISDVDVVIWQKSYDGDQWEDVDKQEPSADGWYEYEVADSAEVVYYRTVASSACGETRSRAYKVSTVYAPVILDKEMKIINTPLCVGDSDFYYVRIVFFNPYSDIYAYTYKTIGYDGPGVFQNNPYAKGSTWEELGKDLLNKTKDRLTDTTKTDNDAYITCPKHSFDVEVTRIVKATGAKSSKVVHVAVNEMASYAKFRYVIDGMEEHESGGEYRSVRLNQGSRVVFTPEVESNYGNLSYKWDLIAPLNTEYYKKYGGSVGREGLTSEREEPVCYFYNGGGYKVQMTVTDGHCTTTVRDSALYIDMSTVRSYSMPALFEDYVDENVVLIDGYDDKVYVDVFPTHVANHFDIITTSEETEKYEVFDAKGLKIKEDNFVKKVRVDISGLSTGVYFVSAAGKVVKIVKE